MGMDEKTSKLLEGFAEKLGTTVEHLWRVTLKQAWIESVEIILIGIFMFILDKTYVGYLWDFIESGERWEDGWIAAAVLSGAALLIATMVYVFEYLGDLPTRLFNREYFAFRRISKMIRG